MVVAPNKPRQKVNNEFTLPVASEEEHVSHVTPVNGTIHATLLNEEEDIKVVNENGAMRETKRRSGMMIMKIMKAKLVSTLKTLMRTIKLRMMTRLSPIKLYIKSI